MGFADYQNEVYLNGLGDQSPAYPVAWRDLEAAALATMSPQARGYVGGGAGGEETMRANREAFDRWRIVPRMLRGIPAQRDLATTVLGTDMPAPVMLAPVGVLGIVHPDGELAVARAASAMGVPMVTSTAATTPMEQIAEAAGDGPRWYQLYWPKSRELAASLVHRAEVAGYTAIVFTLDTWQLGWRPRDLDTAYLPFLQGVGNAQYFSDPVFRGMLDKSPQDDPMSAILLWSQQFANPELTWDDIAWLRAQTSLPIVVKGVQHPDDARLAMDAGAAAMICSNHGGRQVDGAVGSLDALPGIVAAAGDLPVLFDSGIRTGADAVKALALGAKAVLLARSYVYGLAVGGEAGVTHVLRTFLADLDLQLGLSGHASIADLGLESLTRRD